MFIPFIHTLPFDQCSGRPDPSALLRVALSPSEDEHGRGVQAGAAGALMAPTSFRKLVQWIREEFEAAPDLRLTTREAAAFLGLDPATCERILVQLLRAGLLAQGTDGRFRAVTATM
jgi:hypothetical protein